MTHGSRYYMLVGCQIVVALVLLALLLSLYKYTERMLIKQCDEKAIRDMERIQLTIQKQMVEAEAATSALSALIFDNGKRLPKTDEEIYTSLERYLDAMPPSITGAIIGFEDGVMPQYEGRWGFFPLVRHVNDEYVRYQLGNVRDIRELHDWYRETKRQDCTRWATPQWSEEGEVICGYCMPLHDANDRLIGVLEVDFSLDKLSAEVCNIRSYPNAEPMVVDRNLMVLMAPDHDVVLKETMPTLLHKRGLEMENRVQKNVTEGVQASYHLRQGDFKNPHEVFFFHMPEPHTGWTIQMTCPASDVTIELEALKVRMGVIAASIIGLMLLVALTFLRENDKT